MSCKYKEHINKIISSANFDIEVISIENISKLDKHLSYCICNSPLINNLINEDVNLINKDFYALNKSKKDIQLLLENSNIFVPKITTTPDCFPLYFKENRHEGIVKKVNSLNEIPNVNDYYLEEIIVGFKESKYYFIYDKVFDAENEINNQKIKKLCFDICNILNLQIFSIDVITNENINYVIDVNPSPGFYKSDIARNYFIKYLNKLINLKD